MRIGTFLDLVRRGRLTAYPRIIRTLNHAYRLSYISAGFRSGTLPAIGRGEGRLDELVERFGHGRADVLEAWLDVGVSIGELRREPDGYSIKGSLTRFLLDPANDDLLALMQEAASLHMTLIDETPRRLEEGRPFTLDDQDGELVARTSESVAPLVREAVDRLIPARGRFRLLEVGCGSAAHVRYASLLNPELETVALELQAEVADRARENLELWGLADRAVVVIGDVREWKSGAEFDAATLHNMIYYFEVGERVSLLERVRGHLRPGGRILLTSGSRRGSSMMEVLNLWGAATSDCGMLPGREELLEQLVEAGFVEVRAVRLLPGEEYYAFFGAVPS